MNTTIELEQIHTFARNAVLINTGMDYIIFKAANFMRGLSPATEVSDNLKDGFLQPQQITIEDPYFIPKAPIFNLTEEGLGPTTPTAGVESTESLNLEEEFNTGNLPRSLFTLIRSLPIDETDTDKKEIAVLRKIKLYTDHTSALFIQSLLSYSILYPDKFLALKILDNKAKLVTIKNKVQEKYRDISNAELESITDFILLIIDTFGNSPVEDEIIKLLNDLAKGSIPPSNDHNWLELKFEPLRPKPLRAEQIKNFTKTVDLFHRLLNSMNVDLICGIPTESARVSQKEPGGQDITNDLLSVSIDVKFMEKILEIWKYLLASDNVTPVMISFLKDELPRIFGYFEEAEPLPGGEEYIDISRVIVKEYLDTFLKQNIIAKLIEITGRPSSEAVLKIFRSLQIFRGGSVEEILPDPNIINFLFTITFILQEYPALSTLHVRSEVFEHGHQTDPNHPSKVRINRSPQIFPGIIGRKERVQLLESVELEQEYNRIKNEVTDLDLRIGQVGQLQNLLKTARGIPL